MPRTAGWIPAVFALLSMAGTAIAQNKPESPRREPPLKGPTVKDGGVPGEYRSFGGSGKGGKDRMQQETPHRLFVRAFDVLRGEQADEAVRLTDSQAAQLTAIDEQFTASVASYRKEYQTEARELAAKLPPEDRRRAIELLGGQGPKRSLDGAKPKNGTKRGGPGQADKPMQEADAKAVEDARERLKEILLGAPKVADTHSKMYAVLTDAQKPLVQKELERLKKEMAGRREPGKVEKGIERGKGDLKNKGGRGVDAKPLTLDDPRIPEQALQRIKSLPPEKQAEALKRLQERLKNQPPR